MAAKKSLTTTFTPPGILAFSFIAKPDDKAPEGSKFKPDGKYKGTLVFDVDTDLSKFEAILRRAAREEFGKDVEDLFLPLQAGKSGGEMDGKMKLQAKTIKQPECVDAKGRAMPAGVFPKSGDKCVFKMAIVPFQKPIETPEVYTDAKGKPAVRMVPGTMYGVSARLYGVQVIERGAAGSAGGWEQHDGYEAADEPARSNTGPQGGGDDSDDLPF